MLKLAAFYNKKPSICANALKIIDELKRIGLKVSVEKLMPDTELVLALGGDGTYLRVAHLIKQTNLPILAVRLGRLGFMSEISASEVIEALELYKLKKFTLDKRALLDITIKNKGKLLYTDTVLNEAVISRDGIARLFDLKVISAGTETIFHADGVIIATPTGSTAYNLSAGGPIVSPENEKYIITPICPHAVNWKSLLIDNVIKTIVIPEINKKVKLAVTCDGSKVIPLKPDDALEVQKSKLAVNFIRFKPYNFKKVFREKFGKQK